jgi:hypothetical protein
MTENFMVKRTPKPWVVIERTVHDSGRVYHFETRAEAEAFAKAEQAEWDEEYRKYLRQEAEWEEINRCAE